LALLCSCLAIAPAAQAADAFQDTTWVSTFDEEFINWASAHVQDFVFPSNPEVYSEVLLFITIACPDSPGDCDPWDRLGHLSIIHEDPPGTDTYYEIARFITPYDITGPPHMPQTCTWVLDVTDYKFLLTGTVTLSLYIESWIGGDEGWLMTTDFAFVHGVTELQPYMVVNLWHDNWMEYGNPNDPIEDYLQPVWVDIPADAAAAKVRAVVTGHGQGNTFNCAEFCARQHTVVVGGEDTMHILWRNDCALNECSPQYGTWQYGRAGWCPGDKVDPWDNEITHLLTPGEPLLFDYNVQDYFNECGPHNPDCIDGETCPDCDYNYTGHTIPIYSMSTQLILYRSDLTGAPAGGTAQIPRGLRLGQNYPNPFNPVTTFYYELNEPGDVRLRIYSAGGRMLLEVERSHSTTGTYWYQWNGRDAHGQVVPIGVYFYEVESGGARQAKKMILLQ